MYKYVDKSVADRYRSDCSQTLEELRDLLYKEYGINTQFTLIGSGGNNLITQNGKGPFDLDYNLMILSTPEEYWRNLRLLKETVRISLNKVEHNEWFTDGKDSTSVITAILHFKNTPEVEFKFDLAILSKNSVGNWQRLKHIKECNQFIWNEVPHSKDVRGKADALKHNGYWPEVRDVYLEKKNMYLLRKDTNHPSFVVYVETINEIYYKYF